MFFVNYFNINIGNPIAAPDDDSDFIPADQAQATMQAQQQAIASHIENELEVARHIGEWFFHQRSGLWVCHNLCVIFRIFSG